MKNVKVPISEILSIVSCAESYGFDDVLLSTLAEWSEGFINITDLEQYAKDLSEIDGYEEEYDNCLFTLKEWYNRYII